MQQKFMQQKPGEQGVSGGLQGVAAAAPAEVDAAGYQAAFEALRSEALALRDADLIPVNVDVPRALSIVVGALPQLLTLRAELSKLGNAAPLATVDKLELYTRALAYTHTLTRATLAEPKTLQQLGRAATKLRKQLVMVIRVLIARGLIAQKQIATLKGPPGYLNLAFDLFLLAAITREHWTSIQGGALLTMADVVAAEALAHQLLANAGARDTHKENVARAAKDKQRQFTLLVNAYAQVRRAAQFLWSAEEADRIAPSIYLARRARQKPAGLADQSEQG